MREMLSSITKDITRFFLEYAPSGCLFACGTVLVCIIVVAFIKRQFVLSSSMENVLYGKTFVRKLEQIFVLVLYLYIVIGITILFRSESGTREMSVELFRTFRNTFQARKQIYENIIMFVPYAILLYGLAKPFQKLWVALLIGMVSSLMIEVTQWITHTGYFELDDILTNTIGMLLGYVLAYFISKLKEKIQIRRIG